MSAWDKTGAWACDKLETGGTTAACARTEAWDKIQAKVKQGDEVDIFVKEAKRSGKKIVFSNGCFDILHLGHVEYLCKASQEGEILILGLNSDASVKRLKGEARPINDQRARALVLSSLQCVDAVVIFEEDTPLNLIKRIEPDVLIKGGDYSIDTIVGAKEVLERGGKVKTIELVEGYSSSKIIEKSKEI